MNQANLIKPLKIKHTSNKPNNQLQVAQTIVDAQYSATTYIYQLPKGTKLIHTIDPKTADTIIRAFFKAGALYEEQHGVPSGTSHFLEHIIGGNPNSKFKTKSAIDNYVYGDASRPSIINNAWTSRFLHGYWAYTNSQGESRLADYMKYKLIYPIENIGKYIEKERKIILAERGEHPKISEDWYRQLLSFLFNGSTRYSGYVLGEIESIKAITKEDIEKYYTKALIQPKLAFSLQSPTASINPQLLNALNSIESEYATTHSNGTYDIEESFENSYQIDYFRDKKADSVSFFLFFFEKESLHIDYAKRAKNYLLQNLLSKLIFDILREKLGYIYSSRMITDSSLTQTYDLIGMNLKCTLGNLTKALDQLYKIVFIEAQKFLISKNGVRWLNDIISSYLFPNTYEFDRSYAFIKASTLLHGHEIADFEKEKKSVAETTTDDIIIEMQRIFKIPMRVFITSDLDEKTVIQAYKKSHLHNHFSQL